MTPAWFFILCEISVIACGVVSGVFLTFSDFVMRSLDGARTAAGVEVSPLSCVCDRLDSSRMLGSPRSSIWHSTPHR